MSRKVEREEEAVAVCPATIHSAEQGRQKRRRGMGTDTTLHAEADRSVARGRLGLTFDATSDWLQLVGVHTGSELSV